MYKIRYTHTSIFEDVIPAEGVPAGVSPQQIASHKAQARQLLANEFALKMGLVPNCTVTAEVVPA